MKLRSGTSLSVHVCCWSREREPFFLKRSALSPEEKASIPSPRGSLRNRCEMVINLNETIDHFAFLVLSTDPAGLRERIMRGFGRFLNCWLSSTRYTMNDISGGDVCGIQFKYLVQCSMSYALERELEEHIGEHSELIRNEWPVFYNCYCGGPENDLYMMIGAEFHTECYHCYARTFEDRLLESRRTFISYVSMIAETLVVEGVGIILKSTRKNCSLKEMCEMAASIGVSMRRNVLLAPHGHFLMATRRAFNDMLGLDSQHDKGWELVRSPRDPSPGGEASEESDFEGYGSDDSQATMDYSMPNSPGELGEASHVNSDFEGNDSNDDGEFPEAA